MLPAFAVAGSVSPWATEKARVIAQRIAELAEFREIFRSSFLEAPASIELSGVRNRCRLEEFGALRLSMARVDRTRTRQ